MKAKLRKSIKFLRKQLVKSIKSMSLSLKPYYSFVGHLFCKFCLPLNEPWFEILVSNLHKNIYISEMLWKKVAPHLNLKFFFLVRIHGEINISPDIAACLPKHSIVQVIAEKISLWTKFSVCYKRNNAFFCNYRV